MKFLVFMFTITLITPALAAGPCLPTDKMFLTLQDRYQEKKAFVATGSSGFDVTVTVSPAGSWTMVAQNGDIACIVGAGDKWKAAPTAATPELLPGLQKNNLILIHSWYDGLHNTDGEICCGGSDCGPVDDQDVTPVPGGYNLHITKFDPMASGTGPAIYTTIPNAFAKPAKEGGQYHLCYWGGKVKCFFFPAPSY
jgi:hypothetical protein